jgi:hypothetical protein|tara:strand:- start:549 stop:1100 length:552 start_codon:yes stop_codon:yes gene_type:complete
MKKVVLSEIDYYYGEIKTPKHFEIKRAEIKGNILESFVDNKRMSDDDRDYSYLDYVVEYSKELSWLQDHFKDHYKIDHKNHLIPVKNWGNVYAPKEQSFLRNTVDPLDLRHSPDYTFVYGIDVQPESCQMVIEFNRNRREGRKWFVKMKSNFFVMFPSTLKYFITPNLSRKRNIFLTTTYEFK